MRSFFRQLLKAEREEAMRRELAVGTAPEVRRSDGRQDSEFRG